MSKVKFTGKVGAKRMNFMKEGTKELHSAYYATVESTDGQMFTIKDPSDVPPCFSIFQPSPTLFRYCLAFSIASFSVAASANLNGADGSLIVNICPSGKVGAKRMNFMKEGTKELHSAYYATVESTDGQMFTIKDPSAPFKLAEAATEKEAMEKALFPSLLFQ